MPRKQCKKCPWKVGTDPFTIPNDYSPAKHKALADTIAEPGSLRDLGGGLRIFTCHETTDLPCVGWLLHQLGPGNNIGLRLAVSMGRFDAVVEADGPQHRCFEDTLP